MLIVLDAVFLYINNGKMKEIFSNAAALNSVVSNPNVKKSFVLSTKTNHLRSHNIMSILPFNVRL